MRSGLVVKWGLPTPGVGMIGVTVPPAAGTHTNSAATGPKNAAPAYCSSRAAARTATMRSPAGDHARSLYSPPGESVCVLHVLQLELARTMLPPFASLHVVKASALPSGLHAGPNSPTSLLLTRCGVPLGSSTTYTRSSDEKASRLPSGDGATSRI